MRLFSSDIYLYTLSFVLYVFVFIIIIGVKRLVFFTGLKSNVKNKSSP